MKPEFFAMAHKLTQKRESLTFGELLSAFGKKPADTFKYSDWCDIVNELAKNGLGLVPNKMLFGNFTSLDSPMFPYESSINHLNPPTEKIIPHFQLVLVMLSLGSYIMSEAGVDSRSIEEELLECVEKFQNSKLNFNASDMAGIRSNIDYLLLKPPEEKFLREMKANSPDKALEFIQGTSLMFLTKLLMRYPSAVSVVDKAFDLFDLNQVVSKFQAILESQAKKLSLSLLAWHHFPYHVIRSGNVAG